ncbi:MAG: DUF5337 domain-containing protein [Rhodobacteraceae bacterium]|nr:DUF5337 domain-containing protein [Paracoccaceae bacterium]
MGNDLNKAMAKKSRHISLVIAVSVMVWLPLQFLFAPVFGLPQRYMLLFDFVVLAALIYAGVNILQLRRMRRDSKG